LLSCHDDPELDFHRSSAVGVLACCDPAGYPPCAVHLAAGSTTSPILTQIARSKLARPLVDASVERFSRAKHVFTCIFLQSSTLHRLFGCIRSVSGSASYGVQGHSANTRMQTYADAQHARASCSFLSTRLLHDFYTLQDTRVEARVLSRAWVSRCCTSTGFSHLGPFRDMGPCL